MNGFVKGNPDLCMGCRTGMIACVAPIRESSGQNEIIL